jgi:hypothetical protein
MRLNRTTSLARTFEVISSVRQDLAARWDRFVPNLVRSYRPERHYMRGPGPKTLGMIGRRLRAETESVTRERLPEGWLDLIQSLDEREGKQSEGPPRQSSRE